MKARYDYLPFGEELPSTLGARISVAGYGLSDGTRQKFTQKERDSESGLDYFLARYYSSAQGRFTSVDMADAELRYPQDWNRYAYTLNNPLRYTDPDGQKWAVQYSVGQVTFKWYEGDTIPTGEGWEGTWREYTAGWYIGANEAIRLDPHGPREAFRLSRDLFSQEDWAKLQSADPAHFTHEQREILFSAASSIVNELPHGQRRAIGDSVTTAIAIVGLSAELSIQRSTIGPKSQVPPTPGGMTQKQFGEQVMKWGQSGAEARARIASLTREELERAGVTKAIAKAWRNFYRNEASSGRMNPSAAGRAELMSRAVKLLKGE
jgi:RHS repeat-associated protein